MERMGGAKRAERRASSDAIAAAAAQAVCPAAACIAKHWEAQQLQQLVQKQLRCSRGRAASLLLPCGAAHRPFPARHRATLRCPDAPRNMAVLPAQLLSGFQGRGLPLPQRRPTMSARPAEGGGRFDGTASHLGMDASR